MQETRDGVPIGVLHETLHGIQQQIDEQANAIGLLGAKIELKTTFPICKF